MTTTYLLEVLHKLLQQRDTLRLQLTREERTGSVFLRKEKKRVQPADANHSGALATHLADPRQLLIVFKEEGEVLVRDVDLGIAPKLPVLLLRLLAAGEPVLVHLVLDLRGRVRHEDARRGVARAHLRLRALQRGEELAVQQRRLRVLELGGDVAREPEVRVLVDRAGDEAGDVRGRAEDLREGVGEGGRGLDRGEVDLPDVVAAQTGTGRLSAHHQSETTEWWTHESLNPNVAFAWL